MSLYPSPFYNWCTCSATVDTPQPCGNTGKCVRAPHLLVKQEDSVFPCGENGIIPIAQHITLPTGVDPSTAFYTIVKISVNLSNVTIDQNNINFTSNYDPTVEGSSYSVAEIKYRVRSGSLSDTGTIVIIFKSKCTGIILEQDEYCDPCLGVLKIESEISIASEVSIGNTTDNLKITG